MQVISSAYDSSERSMAIRPRSASLHPQLCRDRMGISVACASLRKPCPDYRRR